MRLFEPLVTALESGYGSSCVTGLTGGQRGPEVFLLAKCFLEAWGIKGKKPHIVQKQVVVRPCRLRRQGQKTIGFWKMRGFWALVLKASKKNTWPKKHFGINLIGFVKRLSFGGLVMRTKVSAGGWPPIWPIPASAGMADRRQNSGRHLSLR